MKKNIAFAFLVCGGILALSSCKDDDMEVYVGEDLRDKEIIEAIKALPEPKTEIDENDIDAKVGIQFEMPYHPIRQNPMRRALDVYHSYVQ